jgi:hypothetical protein
MKVYSSGSLSKSVRGNLKRGSKEVQKNKTLDKNTDGRETSKIAFLIAIPIITKGVF